MNCFLSAVAVLAFASFSPAQKPLDLGKPITVDEKLDAILAKLTACDAKFTAIERRLDALEAKAPRAMTAAAQPVTGFFPQAAYGDCGPAFAARYAAAGDCGSMAYGVRYAAAGDCGVASAAAGAGDCGAASSGRRTGPIRAAIGRFFGRE